MIDLLPNYKEGDEFGATALNAIISELRRLGKIRVAAPLGMSDGPGGISIHLGANLDKRVWAKVSSVATKDGTYNGKSASRNATAFDQTAAGALSIATYYDFASSADCVLVNYFEAGTGSHILPVDCVVFGWLTGSTSDGKPLIELDHFFAGAFAVALTQTAGSNGTKTTTASWTYTVKTVDSAVTLGTGVALTRPRPNGTATAGTKGLAYYDASGALKLWDAGEIYGTGPCA